MRKKITCLLAAILSLAVLVGCGASSGTSSSGTSSEESVSSEVTSSENSPSVSTERKTVEPLAWDVWNADGTWKDGEYAVSFEKGAIEDSEAGFILHAEVSLYDRYSASAVERLQAGDVLRRTDADGTVSDLTVETVTGFGTDGSGLELNGGLEEGGVTLLREGDCYRTLSYDDYPEYYNAGRIDMTVEYGTVVEDASGDPHGEEKESITMEQLWEDSALLDNFWSGNTTVKVKDGHIVGIARRWTP